MIVKAAGSAYARRGGIICRSVSGGVAAFSPSDISGLELWLDASDASTITLNGSNVSQWDDKSGNGYHATQGVAADQPLYNIADINGLNTVEFDGVTEIMSNATLPNIASQPATSSIVYTREGTSVTTSQRAMAHIAGGNNWLIGPYQSNNQSYTGAFISGSAIVASQVYIATLIQDAVQAELFNDTVSQGTTGTNNTMGAGYKVGGDSGFLEGKVCEVVIYSQAISAANRALLETYLGRWQ